MKVLQILQGQSTGFQFFILDLKLFRGERFLISFGILFQITGPKYLKEPFPLNSELTDGIFKSKFELE